MLKVRVQLQTQYHRSLATDEWLSALEQHLTAAIASHAEFQTTEGSGVVRAKFNEERFMGPRSLVKNDFQAKIDVFRRGFTFRRDQYEAMIRYSPETWSFCALGEIVSTVETRAVEKANWGRIAKFVKRIKSGCTLDEVSQFKCPWCGAPIDVGFCELGDEFLVSCPSGNHFDSSGATKSPPTWWRERIVGPWWLSCTDRGHVVSPAVLPSQYSS